MIVTKKETERANIVCVRARMHERDGGGRECVCVSVRIHVFVCVYVCKKRRHMGD